MKVIKVMKLTPNRPIPELTADRKAWLEGLRPGDLVQYCNGGYCDLYPLAVVTRANAATVFTRWVEEFVWKPSLPAMKRAISSDRDMKIAWDRETGAGTCKWRTHNFILPIEANSFDLWVRKDKETTIPDRYSPPNLGVFEAFRFWLRNSSHLFDR